MKTVTASRQGRVLVVEDERDVAELIRYNLAREGYDVVVAPTGTDALRQVREARPDIVLLDIMVPQLNGWEVCRRLKQDAETRGVPVIMVTGRVEEGDKVLGSPSRRASCWRGSVRSRGADGPWTGRRRRRS